MTTKLLNLFQPGNTKLSLIHLETVELVISLLEVVKLNRSCVSLLFTNLMTSTSIHESIQKHHETISEQE